LISLGQVKQCRVGLRHTQKLRKIPDYVGIGFTQATVTARNSIPIIKELKKVCVMKPQTSSKKHALYPQPERWGFTAHWIKLIFRLFSRNYFSSE
jgi:hypothetical protein